MTRILITLCLAATAGVAGIALTGCASAPQDLASPIATSALAPGAATAGPAGASGTFAKPVTSDRATEMYVWTGFLEKDCSPLSPAITVSKAPAKGDVTFRPDQSTLVQHSTSGKCVGQRMPGTGIYYTAKKGAFGTDSFTVTATTPGGQTATRTFTVTVD